VLLWIALAFGTLIAIGVWRKFGPIQWIWLLFGGAIALLLLWALALIFIIGPEMVRTGPPGSAR
jgi:hypothetical protein